ncbi:MAG: tetratricopeptide repeat protein, partial [Candidatus Dependentiae bacterium]|nr:tetratricopeptide repeat protein [Candidatus Dependentiae bacterium]
FILYKKGDYKGAIAILEKIVDQAPKDVTILRHLAKALNKQGERERAYATINRAIQFTVPGNEKQKLQKIAQQWNKK